MRRLLLLITFVTGATGVWAQGVTTSQLSGRIFGGSANESLPGATVVAIHEPSGTKYGAVSLANGQFVIPAVRVGGPYTVKTSFVGYEEKIINNLYLSLGSGATLNINLTEQATELSDVTITASRTDLFSGDRTGASTNIRKETINSLPTLSRSINDFTRLTPQANGRSFVGADARYNNITIDGSIFNSSFGLADQPGGRTGSTPISLDAIEEIQVNIAPFDVRQAGFIGAGVNAVTRSGTNEFSGSVFYNLRNEGFVGDEADNIKLTTTNFNVAQYGFRLGGPIIKNKLFFFVNGELERRSEPGTGFVANDGTQTATGNVTRVLRTELDALRTYLAGPSFNYTTGPYEGYDNETTSDKFLIKLDYNISDNHRLSLRYNWLDSETDVLLSNSSSLGFGSRRSNNTALNYQNSNYIQFEKINSVIAELNSTFGSKISNQLIAGYTIQNEDRGSKGRTFPLVEIQNAGTTYITFGTEPFTPSNRLEYKTFQLQDNITYFAGSHTVTAGFNLENFEFKNVFFPGSQSVYVYNSLQDFYNDTDANTTNNPTLRRFQLRYSALPGGVEPVQPSEVLYMGFYLQDQFTPLTGLKITAGVRVDIPKFKETGFVNSNVEAASFRGPDGASYSVNTAKLPESNALFSPRLGFNYDILGDRSLQVRGGTGLFTGRPVFVWISNQIGNNGVLTGFEELNDVTTRPFNPDPAAYVPATPTLPTSVEIAGTDPDFKFPQIWRSNIAVDKSLPFGLVGTLEYIYSQDVNGITYFNANLPANQSNFAGADTRPRWTSNRLITGAYTVTSAEVLTNTDKGYSYSFSAKLEKPLEKGFFGLVAYNYGRAKNTIDPGSIARGTWTNNPIVYDPNNPSVSWSNNDQTHRAIASFGYRKEYGDIAATQVSIFWEGRTQGRYSYIYSTDANNDGGINDLLYVPNNQSETYFQDHTITYRDVNNVNQTVTYTAAQQQIDWENYINQDEYLKERRGQYTQRNGALLPWVFRADFSLVQEFFIKVGNKRNTLQLRADVLNIGNLINKKWGVGDAVVNSRPIRHQGFNPDGTPIHRLNTLSVSNTGVIAPITSTYTTATSLDNVWQAQLGIRYIFN